MWQGDKFVQVLQISPVSNNSELIFIFFCHQRSLNWIFIMALNYLQILQYVTEVSANIFKYSTHFLRCTNRNKQLLQCIILNRQICHYPFLGTLSADRIFIDSWGKPWDFIFTECVRQNLKISRTSRGKNRCWLIRDRFLMGKLEDIVPRKS